jgi:hypothetical protein
MAAVTCLGVVKCLDRVNHDKVGAMAFGDIVTLVIPRTQVWIDAATGMAVKTERLFVALIAVAPGCVGDVFMTLNPECTMVGRHAFFFVALAAFANFHLGVVFMGLFCGLACSLLLGLIFRRFFGDGNMGHKGRQSKKHKD